MTLNPYASPIEGSGVKVQSPETSVHFQTFRGKIMPFASTETFRDEVRGRVIEAINCKIGTDNVITVSEHSGNWPFSITVWYRVAKFG